MLGFLPGHLEIFIVLLVAVILFGPRLPKVMRSLGRSIVEFKKGVKGIEDDIDKHSEAQAKEDGSTGPPSKGVAG